MGPPTGTYRSRTSLYRAPAPRREILLALSATPPCLNTRHRSPGDQSDDLLSKEISVYLEFLPLVFLQEIEEVLLSGRERAHQTHTRLFIL